MCYPCPWTVLLPFSPDRTHERPNPRLHQTAACLTERPLVSRHVSQTETMIEAKPEFESRARAATGCRECFTRREVQAPYINVAQPRWVGPKYWTAPFRVAILMLNPGQSRRDSGAKEFLRLIHEFRDGTTQLGKILEGQRESMESWGNPPGRFTGFYIDGLGLDFDDIAFANIAWCATASNRYPGTMLDRCFELHTGPLLKILHPTVVLASGSKVQGFGKKIAAILPEATVIKIALRPSRRARPRAERTHTRSIGAEDRTVGVPTGWLTTKWSRRA